MKLKRYLNENIELGKWYDLMPIFFKVFDEILIDDIIQILPAGIFENDKGITIYDYYINLTDEQKDRVINSKSKIGKRIIQYEIRSKNKQFKDAYKEIFDKKFSYFKNMKGKDIFLKHSGVKVKTFIDNTEKAFIKAYNKKRQNIEVHYTSIQKENKNSLFHATFKKFDVGGVIKPYWDKKEVASRAGLYSYLVEALEDSFEDRRPSNKPSRQGCVFCFESSDDVVNWVRGSKRSVYLVKPLGKTHRADMSCINAYENALAEFKETDEPTEYENDMIDKELDEIIDEYWKGKQCTNWNKHTWEIIVGKPGVEIIKKL